VRGELGDVLPTMGLQQFDAFPLWMWRNTAMLEFVAWLKNYNDPLPYGEKVAVYGMDLYSLYKSVSGLIGYLETVDPDAAIRARKRFSCFDSYASPQQYGRVAVHDYDASCIKVVLEQLVELQKQAEFYPLDEDNAKEAYFNAEQNAQLIKNAERYYRSLFQSDAISWNVRDKHMADCLDHVFAHLKQFHRQPKIIVWAHNSHIGDARATQMSEYGELNVGQLLKEKYGSEVFSVGYSTYSGTVMAASEWGRLGEIKQVRNALPGSYEAVFHELGISNFLLNLRDNIEKLPFLRDHLQRAIGVLYRPDTERYSHYYYADLIDQFDVLLHFDQTTAVQPLDWTAQSLGNEPVPHSLLVE
jgi:erythromycin esterase-like protein